MVALGAFIEATKIADLEKVKEIVSENFKSKPKLVEVNHKALAKGFEVAKGA